MAAGRVPGDEGPSLQRWLVRATRTLFVVTDHPAWRPGPRAEGPVHFLGIARETGAAREGSDSIEGLEAKLKGFSSASGASPADTRSGQACAAVLGVLTAHQESFLLLAAEAALVFEVDGQRVFEITRCEALPFNASAEPSAEAAAALAGVKQLLERNFYFSQGFDLTRRLQHRLLQGTEASEESEEQMLHADDRFVWNRQLVAPLLCQGVSPRWFTPVMQGFVQAREVPPLMILLIARRSCRRAGTRYNARGLDDGGEVGNWVETEQLVRVRGSSSSSSPPGWDGVRPGREPRAGWLALVQVRGSAPLFWEQHSGLSAITVTRGPELGAVAFEKHRRLLEAEYGDVLWVSLLSGAASKRETEGVLTAALNEQLPMHQGVQMVHLDFHARVTGEDGRFDRELDGLADGVARHAQRFGFLDATSSAAIGRRQEGVVRTNCFDCLDRTNILQYQLVWRWLLQYCGQKAELRGLIERGPARSPPPTAGGVGANFETFLRGALGEIMPEETPQAPLQVLLREMWADLGDALSEQYTGTASTMGAALRQGGHNAFTLLEKGWRSVNRAYCARFEDEARQAALELLLGKHRLLRAPTGPPEVRRAPCGLLTVATVTWNLHGHRLWETPGALVTLLTGACAPGSQRAADVVIFCFQEFVELTAANVVMQADGDEERQASFETAATKALGEALGEAFVKVRSVGMVGLYVGAFVAERLRGSVSGVAGDRARVGLYGQAGNKGAVAVRFEVAKTAVCAMSLHLESGAGKAVERAAQLREVLQSCFAPGGPSRDVRLAADKHDLLALGGDFNFRLALPPGADGEALAGIFAGGWPSSGSARDPGCMGEGVASSKPLEQRCLDIFSVHDELMGSQGCPDAKDVLREEGLMEGPVLFPPTYKFLEGTQGYDAERIPAWCDRVLHSKVGVVRRRYCALGGVTQSDHRPVCALLETQLLALPDVPAAASGGGSLAPPRPAQQQEQRQPARAMPETPDLLGFEPAAPAAAPAGASAAPKPAADTVDLLGGGPPAPAPAAVAPAAAPAPVPAPAPKPAPAPALPPPGRQPTQGGLTTGQLVLAQYSGGWYFANVLRAGATTCDVAWLRPHGVQWGSAGMSQYLCSTGADETLHGENLPLATHIRIPDQPGPGPQSSKPPPATASPDLLDGLGEAAGGGTTAPAAGGDGSGLVDLLG